MQSIVSGSVCHTRQWEFRSVVNLQVQLSLSAITGIEQMKKDTEELHEELLALLAEHPELTNSDRTSSVSNICRLSAGA